MGVRHRKYIPKPFTCLDYDSSTPIIRVQFHPVPSGDVATQYDCLGDLEYTVYCLPMSKVKVQNTKIIPMGSTVYFSDRF